MERRNEKGITLIAIIIIIFAAIIIIGGVTIVILSKNRTQNNVINESRNTSENINEKQDKKQKNENSNSAEEKVELEDQTMYAKGNANWKQLMKPENVEMYLYSDNNNNPYITIKPIFDKYYAQPNNVYSANENIPWTYYSAFETKKGEKNYNQIYTWAHIVKEETINIDKDLKFNAEYNGDDNYVKETRIHSGIKEKVIKDLKIKYVQIQAKKETYMGNYKDGPTEVYVNRYDCIIEFIEPSTKKVASIDFKIEQETNNTDNFVDESIIDEVVSRLTLNGIQTIN